MLLGARLSETAQFDSKTGALVEVEQFKDRSAVSKFRYINRFLHTGEILGLPLMILYFLACLVGTSLPITGTIIWINKINQRRRILT
ncbi:MAG: PepSY domain-containing protein [Saprospiraceae bacterium]|nr:PepSY domain-containing protein [Saprospiraceae bacterium]